MSPTHFHIDELHEVEERLSDHGALLSYDIIEARIVLSKVERKRRAQFDLQGKGLWTKEVTVLDVRRSSYSDHTTINGRKRRKLDANAGLDEENVVVIQESDTESEVECSACRPTEPAKEENPADVTFNNGSEISNISSANATISRFFEDTVKVLRLDWLNDSCAAGAIKPLEGYLIFEGCIVPAPERDGTPSLNSSTPRPLNASYAQIQTPQKARTILERAKADAAPRTQDRSMVKRGLGQNQHRFIPSGASFDPGSAQYAHLLHQTTSEYDEGASSDLPEMPDWVKKEIKYACQRDSPLHNPNDEFIDLLKKIRTARLLTNDEIGVRAYSTSIAAIASYPYKISNPREILAFPGCDGKIANLFVEYANTGRLRAAEDAENNDELKVLQLFFDIWGVGALTAREFYYDRGWRDLDDIVEYGWSTLTRVQQIGVKYYEEFLSPLPRSEVEQIASIIHRHAVKVRDEGIQSLLVGGYRRGKPTCGDVDIVVSHPEEAQTLNIVNDIVASLEEEGWITHTLLLTLTMSQRGQKTLPFRGGGSGGHGFDTLDKALVVWQDPHWPTRDADLAANPRAKNPNIHRRVDIIISPWRTVGCAVAGWSGGTTFQRDIRRYAKNIKGWKFDSSGIRDRATGHVVDVERYEGDKTHRATSMVEAEKRVFEGLGIDWREASLRCTG